MGYKGVQHEEVPGVYMALRGKLPFALSVLYTSSVTKTVAVCASLVLTTVLGNAFFDAPLDVLPCFERVADESSEASSR